PLKAGMSIGMLLISIELFLMLCVLLFIPGDLAFPCFIGFAIGESLGAAALRIAGGIFTKIADIGSDLMKIVFKIKEDDARNPGVIADCTGDNAGDSVGPSADGFETYGVTGVALITFILLAVPQQYQVQLLVWIFMMRIVMVLASLGSYALNGIIQGGKYKNADHMNFEAPLTFLVWLTSIVSVVLTFIVSRLLIPDLGGDGTLWWKLSAIITCGTLAGAIIPEAIKAFTSTESRHVREVVTASREGGASLNVISGLVAGNFSAYWMGIIIAALMGGAYFFSLDIPNTLMISPAVFAFGLVAFGFLGMGPVTIAVDSYGPVTDNAQSVYELSLIENVPNIKAEVQKDFGFSPDFEKGKEFLEENDGAGNTFKATAKPVLIGTAVVGATTMTFSIIVILVGLTRDPVTGLRMLNTAGAANLSLLHAPFLLGLVTGGAIIYWFSGASMQAVSTGAYRAVEFIKANIKLEGVEKASVADSKRVVEICTQYAQKGMLNIFLGVFFSTLAFACLEPYFFVGYLISIAIFGLYQAVFMANAGGAWDNAKKLVETELKAKGTELHAATVVGDTVGDPFKDTSSVALNPVIKFTTLFGLLAVELAVELNAAGQGTLTRVLAAVFFVASLVFVYRSFYGMRIETPMATLAGNEAKPGVKPA
ncbi:MAG: sodium-translocating pyrophosphatase, partial [Archangium sp.]